ncbi:MAG: protein-L-isoaspartate(D-aspartate) O-methyltransferase [Vampirovibrionia bacterium]
MNDRNFLQQRQNLVNSLKVKGIKDQRVLDAMLNVSRHEFVNDNLLDKSYLDEPQPIGEGQTISQPYIVALMTQELQLKGHEKVLELGTGSGYQTAILCELAGEVYSIERIESLYLKSTEKLASLGYNNIKLFHNDGSLGLIEYAPYDAIIVTATSPVIPNPLIDQLAVGGRMIIPVGPSAPQDLLLVTKLKDSYISEYVCSVYFVPLIGKYAWHK